MIRKRISGFKCCSETLQRRCLISGPIFALHTSGHSSLPFGPPMTARRLPRLLSCLLALTTTLLPINGLRAADDPERPAELKPLHRWVGEWDMEVAIKPNDFQ